LSVLSHRGNFSYDYGQLFRSEQGNICALSITDEPNASITAPYEGNDNDPTFIALEAVDGIDFDGFENNTV
jgi:hypothetical protein